MKAPLSPCSLALACLLPFSATAAAPAPPTPPDSAEVDALLEKFWKARGVKPNPLVDDATYARRLYLDVVGRIPTAAEAREFLADTRPDKRGRLVDRLLDSEGYVSHQFNFWADILRVNTQQGGGGSYAVSYIDFVKDSLRRNVPYDQFVRELISGENTAASTAYYYRDRGMPLDNMANTVRIFLGTRLECAQCHNHPFDKWTQMDFYHMAAFSYGVGFQNGYGGQMSEVQRVVQNDPQLSREEKSDLRRAFQEISRPLRNDQKIEFRGERLPELPHDYKYEDAKPKEKIGPRTLFGEELEIVSDGAKLATYAKWMTSPENPRFTLVIANRLWKQAMGLGLIEPVDEIMDNTEATSPELMAYLSRQMIDKKHDMKAFLRMLYKTRAYQREAVAADFLDPREFAFTGPLLRRMSAEQVWDSLATLINPDLEQPDWKRSLEAQVRNASYELLSGAIASKSQDELIADARRIADRQRESQKELGRLQKELVDARQRKDQKKAQELSRQTNRLQSELRQMVFDSIYKPAIQKKNLEMASLELPGDLGEIEMKPEMVDDNGRPTQQLRRRIEEAEKQLIERQMDRLGIVDERERRNLQGFLRTAYSNWVRAANLPSPAPAGHFLQQFGQSDRETIQNAESAASVPQALTLLNGNIFETVVNAGSVLSREVKAADTPDAKIDAIFLSLLGRQSRPEEREVLLADSGTRGEKIYQDAVFALMNSQEFLFVK